MRSERQARARSYKTLQKAMDKESRYFGNSLPCTRWCDLTVHRKQVLCSKAVLSNKVQLQASETWLAQIEIHYKYKIYTRVCLSTKKGM